ncbi:MAG: Bug family tripartite tricarboxylate transporter substrate binding protein [Betaproteobacteria bacterium]
MLHLARHLIWLICGVVVAVPSMAVAQDSYPSRPIRILVGFQAGGSVDLTARLVGEHLAKSLGTPVIVENKVGASGMIAGAEVAKAAADGYTLFMANMGSSALAPHMQAKPPYDPVKDFTPISQLVAVYYVAAVPSTSPADNITDFIKWAKQSPDVTFASAGVGSTGHMNGELLNQAAGLKMRHVPYKGSPQAVTDLMAGRTSIYIDVSSVLKPHAMNGKLKALYVTSPVRDPDLAQVPTIRELGHPNLETSGWQGLVGPAGVPQRVVSRLAAEIRKILALPAVRDRLRLAGQPVVDRGPRDFAAFIKAENERVISVIKTANMRNN